MRRIVLAAALYLSATSAHAECKIWSYDGTMCMGGTIDNMPYIPTSVPHPVPGTGVTITAAPHPTCEEGWRLVDIGNTRPMCAREFKEPNYR